MTAHAQRFGGIRRQLRKKVETGTGFTSVADGYEEGEIQISVDLAEICRLFGTGAMKNKSGRSKLLKGAVEIRVLKRQRVAA